MWALLAHFYKTAGLWCKLVFHRRDLDFSVKRSFCNQVLLIDFRNRLGSHQRVDFNLFLSFASIHIKIFTLFLVVKVSLFLFLEGLPFLINLTLGEHTWLNVDLSYWLKIYIYSVITLFLLVFFVWLLFLCLVQCVVQLCDDLWIELSRYFSCFWSEYPIWHSGKGFLPLWSFKVV